MGVTHLLSISPAENSSCFASVMNHHVSINSQSPEALLLVLPSICDYIRDSVKNNGLVLVHCRIESRACMAVCAYRKFFLLYSNIFFLYVFSNIGWKLIWTSILCDTKWSVLFICFVSLSHLFLSFLVLPLFNPTKIFLHNLERFQSSLLMAATSEHIIVNDAFSSSQRQQQQSNSAAVTKSSSSSSSNVLDRNESNHTATRRTFISVR